MIAIVILLVLPLILDFRENFFIINTILWTLLYAYLAESWNILSGYAGQFSFGHTAFFGIGAYTTAMLYLEWGISPWIGMLIGGLLSVIASLAIGVPSLRVKGNYFVFATLTFSECLRLAFKNWDVVGGARGLSYDMVPFSIWAFQFNTLRILYYYIILAMLLAIILVAYFLQKSKLGYRLVAIREDEDLAQVSGIDITKYKLIAAAISAFLTALGGTFYAQYVLYIHPESAFSMDIMVRIFMPAALGGMGTLLGPVLGSFILIPLGEYVRRYVGYIQGLHLVIYGAILVIVALYLRGGIMKTKLVKRLSSS